MAIFAKRGGSPQSRFTRATPGAYLMPAHTFREPP
jgi:hypothetical protein